MLSRPRTGLGDLTDASSPGPIGGNSLFSVAHRPSMVGFLIKEGHVRRNWKKRWFVLTEGTLFYFEGPPRLVPTGCISLLDGEIEEASTVREHCFQVVTPTRTYNIVAESAESMCLWMECCRRARSLASDSAVQSSHALHIAAKTYEPTVETWPITSGFLQKEGIIHKNWKRRWFLCSPDGFLYYFNEVPTCILKGTVPIKGSTTVPCSTKREFCMKLSAVTHIYYLQATSQRDLGAWIRALNECGGVLTKEIKDHLPAGRSSDSPATTPDTFAIPFHELHSTYRKTSVALSTPLSGRPSSLFHGTADRREFAEAVEKARQANAAAEVMLRDVQAMYRPFVEKTVQNLLEPTPEGMSQEEGSVEETHVEDITSRLQALMVDVETSGGQAAQRLRPILQGLLEWIPKFEQQRKDDEHEMEVLRTKLKQDKARLAEETEMRQQLESEVESLSRTRDTISHERVIQLAACTRVGLDSFGEQSKGSGPSEDTFSSFDTVPPGEALAARVEPTLQRIFEMLMKEKWAIRERKSLLWQLKGVASVISGKLIVEHETRTKAEKSALELVSLVLRDVNDFPQVVPNFTQ